MYGLEKVVRSSGVVRVLEIIEENQADDFLRVKKVVSFLKSRQPLKKQAKMSIGVAA